jgi:hypothetical protein
VVWNVPVACNRATADLIISSALLADEYERLVPDYDDHRHSGRMTGAQWMAGTAALTGAAEVF